MKESLEGFERWFRLLNFFWWLTGLPITSEKPRSLLYGMCTTWTVPMAALLGFWFLYMLCFEDMTLYMIIQQLWATLAVFQISIKFINRFHFWAEKDNLINWFRDIYVREYSPEYLPVIDKYLNRTNYQLKIAFWSVKWTIYIGPLKFNLCLLLQDLFGRICACGVLISNITVLYKNRRITHSFSS